MEIRLNGSFEIKNNIVPREKKESKPFDEKSELNHTWLDLEKSIKSRFQLPNWESLQSWYYCAISEEILKQGRLCVFRDWLVFYCDLPMLEVEHIIPVWNIKRVTPEVTAFFFHNAIKITMESGKEYMFRSFFSRDEALALIEERIADKRTAVSEDYITVKGGKVKLRETMLVAATAILNQVTAAPGHKGDVDITIPNIPEQLDFKVLLQEVIPISSKLFVERFLVNDELPWTKRFKEEGCLDIVVAPWSLKNENSCECMSVDFWKKLKPGEVPKILGTFERVDVHREYRRKADASAGVARMHIMGKTKGVPYADTWCSHEIWNFAHSKKGTRLKVEFGMQWLQSVRIPGLKGTIRRENSTRTKRGILKWIEDVKEIIAKGLSTEETKLLEDVFSLSSWTSSEVPVRKLCSCKKCIIL